MDLLLAIGFGAFILGALFVDLFWLQKKGTHVVAPREALRFTAMWIGLAVAFGVGILLKTGDSRQVTEFFTGYLVEYSLSIDNVFVFTMVFSSLKTPKHLQQKALIYGIIISLVLRFAMILVGTALVERFEVVLYGFGVFLLITGIQMLRSGGHVGNDEPQAIALARRFIHVSNDYDAERFRVAHDGKKKWTPLFLVIVVIGMIDLVFAVDSIPAIFGITKDPFIVFTSNAFAILGLRSLYFLLANAKERFHHLTSGLALVLIFIGAKMIIPIVRAFIPSFDFHLGPGASLLVVVGILGGAVVLSLARPKR